MTKKIGLFGILALTLFIFGSFFLQMSSGPSRTQNAQLDPFGEISVHLETQPDPPKPGGIPLILHITDKSGNPVAVDKVQYEYAFKDQSARVLEGRTSGTGTIQAVASITDVGDWQVRVTLFKGNQQTQVKFTLRVGANI